MTNNPSSIHIEAVGDLVGERMDGGDPFSSFSVKKILDADIVFGNFEAVIADAAEVHAEKAHVLRVSPSAVTNIKKAGFTILNVANNHFLDCGAAVAQATLARLRETGFLVVGAGRSAEEAEREAVLNIRGTSVAVIAAAEWIDGISEKGLVIASLDESNLIRRIEALKRCYDVVVVSLHWGTENVFYPSPRQQRFARLCIEAGARVILGHHPHRVQGVERHKDGVIIYSMGNFNFMPCGVGLTPHENTSAICEICIEQGEGIHVQMIPVIIDESYSPRIVDDAGEADAIRAHFSAISQPLLGNLEEGWWLGEIASAHLTGNWRAWKIRIEKYGWRHAVACAKWILSRYNLKLYIAVMWRQWRKRP